MTPSDANRFFVDLVDGYRAAKCVFAAHDLGLFDLLAAGPLAADEVARRRGCDLRAVAALLKALVAIGLLEHEDGRYRNGELAAAHLVAGRAGYVGNNLRFQDMLWDCWSSLRTVVESGRPAAELGELLGRRDPAFVREYIRGMDNIARAPARAVARLLGDRPLTRLLDVGGGPGTFTLALLERHPTLTATILDLPETLRVADELLAGSPQRDRVELRPGSYLTDAFPRGYDLVLLSHVTHDESPETTLRLLREARSALRPGGRVAIHDFVVDPDGCGPLFQALFSVGMAVYTRGGKTYTADEYAALLGEAGFSGIRAEPVLRGELANWTLLTVGERPA